MLRSSLSDVRFGLRGAGPAALLLFLWALAGACRQPSSSGGRPGPRFVADLQPRAGCSAEGPVGGPFAMAGGSYVLRNVGTVPFPYAFVLDREWLGLDVPATGTLDANASVAFKVAIHAGATPTQPSATIGAIKIRIGGPVPEVTETVPVTLVVSRRDEAAGWTQLRPGPDTRHVYVSATSGNDDNQGLSPGAPKASLRAAMALLRSGHPDWLHIERGGQFTGGLGDWGLSGRSDVEPMVVTTYGSATERPLFRCGIAEGLAIHATGARDVAFVGLHFVADAYDGSNAQPYGVSLLAPCERVLIEDCRIERFFTNVRIQGANTRDVKLRRCVVVDAFSTSGGLAQGMYVETASGCLIEECVFDHNGWLEGVPNALPTVFRHNIYLQGDTTSMVIRGNVIARGGSHGLQARSGGDIRDNLFLGNAINLLVGSDVRNSGANSATVIGNVILDGRDISNAERRGWATEIQCLSSGEIAYNVIAHQVTGSAPVAFNFDSAPGVGVNNVDFHHNVAYRWGAPLRLAGNRFLNLLLRENDLQEFGDSLLVRTTEAGQVAGFLSYRNRFYTNAAADAWMDYASKLMSLPVWQVLAPDKLSAAVLVGYPQAEEDIADYDGALPYGDGEGNLDGFMAEARRQSKTFWRAKFVGTNAAVHFRANFGLQ